MDLDLKIIGNRFKKVREEVLKLSQTELAQEIGTNQVSISNLENGRLTVQALILDLVNYLYEKEYNASLIFQDTEDFEVQGINFDTKEIIITKILDGKEQACKAFLEVIQNLKARRF